MAAPDHPHSTRPTHRSRLRRVLPLWLVLASLFIGLLATAASVVEASYRFAWWNTVLGFRPVAWSAEIHYGDRHGDRIESVRCYAERGMERWHWRPGPFDPDPRDLTPELADQVWGGPMPVYIGPEDDPRPAMARVPDPGYESNPSYLRAGWPFFAAQGREIYGFPTGTSVGRTHEVIGLTTVRIYGRYVEIPFRPIWPGLLGNTLFYAVPAALVLSAVRVVVLGIRHALRSARARRRAKRGRCPACGYELGEGVTICPECGRAMAKHAAMPPHQPTHKPGGPPPPHYLHLAPGVAPPELDRTTPSRAVVVVEADVEMPWRLLVCDWLVHSGCLYVMAWGRECGLWHDCVDECHLAEFGFGDIPDERHAMTTWHEDEPLGDVFRFCQNCASHPHVDLTRTIIMHIAAAPREAELLAAYRAAADD